MTFKPFYVDDVFVEQGGEFLQYFRILNPDGTDMDYTDSVVHMQARADSMSAPFMDLSTLNGGITVGPITLGDGTVWNMVLNCSALVTADMPLTPRTRPGIFAIKKYDPTNLATSEILIKGPIAVKYAAVQ